MRYSIARQEQFRQRNGRVYIREYAGNHFKVFAEYTDGREEWIEDTHSRVSAYIVARREAVKRRLAFDPYYDTE